MKEGEWSSQEKITLAKKGVKSWWHMLKKGMEGDSYNENSDDITNIWTLPKTRPF